MTKKDIKRLQIAKRHGFTLIELLVVISIIAILMAILMPALSKVREQAVGITCRSRFKDMGVMTNLYMQDNDGRMVSNRYHSGGSGSSPGRWTVRLGKYYKMHKQDVTEHGRYNTEMFHCPVEWRKREKTGAIGYDTINGGFHYRINSFLTNNSTKGESEIVIQSKFEKSETWKNVSRLPLFHDTSSDVPAFMMSRSNQMYPAQNLSEYGWALGSERDPRIYRFGPAANHGRGINYLFGDLHVEMTLWPYEGTMSDPEPREYYWKFWHPLGNLSIDTHKDARPL